MSAKKEKKKKEDSLFSDVIAGKKWFLEGGREREVWLTSLTSCSVQNPVFNIVAPK